MERFMAGLSDLLIKHPSLTDHFKQHFMADKDKAKVNDDQAEAFSTAAVKTNVRSLGFEPEILPVPLVRKKLFVIRLNNLPFNNLLLCAKNNLIGRLTEPRGSNPINWFLFRLYEMSSEFWNPKNLMRIAQGIGLPLQINKATKKKKVGVLC